MLKYAEWKINQLVAGCIITFGGFGFGCALSWTATALPSLDETGEAGVLTNIEKSWIASIMIIGALVGSPISAYFLKNCGRKGSLVGFSIVGFTGWLRLASATDPTNLYFGRALLGIASGGYTILVPVYVSEIASKENRGLIGSMFLIMLCFGKLFSNIVGIFFPASIASLLCALHPIVYVAHLMLIPESPKVLMKQKQEKKAFTSLSWYEAKGFQSFTQNRKVEKPESPEKSQAIWITLESMKASCIEKSSRDDTEDSSNSKMGNREFFAKENIKPLITVFIQMMLAQFCGINVSTFYTVEIFQMSGDLYITSKMATVTVALIQTIGCLPCSILVDKYGRRVLLVSSFLFMGLATAGFSAFFYAKNMGNVEILKTHPWLGLIPLISVVVYNLAYSWGVGSVVWIIMSELLPPSIISPASTIANIIFWSSAFFVLQGFQMFKDQIPLHIWFITFSGVCVFGCIFTLAFLPETKGLSLEGIQEFYREKKNISEDVNSEKKFCTLNLQ